VRKDWRTNIHELLHFVLQKAFQNGGNWALDATPHQLSRLVHSSLLMGAMHSRELLPVIVGWVGHAGWGSRGLKGVSTACINRTKHVSCSDSSSVVDGLVSMLVRSS